MMTKTPATASGYREATKQLNDAEHPAGRSASFMGPPIAAGALLSERQACDGLAEECASAAAPLEDERESFGIRKVSLSMPSKAAGGEKPAEASVTPVSDGTSWAKMEVSDAGREIEGRSPQGPGLCHGSPEGQGRGGEESVEEVGADRGAGGSAERGVCSGGTGGGGGGKRRGARCGGRVGEGRECRGSVGEAGGGEGKGLECREALGVGEVVGRSRGEQGKLGGGREEGTDKAVEVGGGERCEDCGRRSAASFVEVGPDEETQGLERQSAAPDSRRRTELELEQERRQSSDRTAFELEPAARLRERLSARAAVGKHVTHVVLFDSQLASLDSVLRDCGFVPKERFQHAHVGGELGARQVLLYVAAGW